MTKLPSDRDLSGAEAVCPHCGSVFSKGRKDQRYCQPACRKDAFQKKDRAKTPVNSRNRSGKRRDNLELFERSARLAEMLYTLPPRERLGFMKDLIDRARSGDAKLRQVLTNRHLLNLSKDKAYWYHQRCPAAYHTLAQAADRYCQKFWGDGIIAVVMGKVPEPPTGEVFD